MMKNFWIWMFRFALRRIKPQGWCASGNRRINSFDWYIYGCDVRWTDLTQNTNYSREDLYRMLVIIRRAERREGWKCPEPSLTEINASGGDNTADHEVELRGTKPKQEDFAI